MRPQPTGGASIWLHAALLLTTSALPGPVIPGARGWRLRVAAPKWAWIWRDHPGAQRRLRVIVMPRPWKGWRDPGWQALLCHGLHQLGLVTDRPDPGLLLQAEREFSGRLGLPWSDDRIAGQDR